MEEEIVSIMGNIWIEDYGQQFFEEYDMQKLQMDECYFTIRNKEFEKVYLFSKFHDCYKCPFTLESTVLRNISQQLILKLKFAKFYRFTTAKYDQLLDNDTAKVIGPTEFGGDFGEFGVYEMLFENGTHQLKTIKEPVDIYLPILTVFLIYAVLFLVLTTGKLIWKKVKFERLDLPFISKAKVATSSKRVQSLDTFRGLSIVLMIFVNYGHGGYAFLEHAVWNGLYIGDLVFPWFLWIMGVCIPISINSYLNKENSKKIIALRNITKRSAKLFAIGLFLNSSTFLDNLRIFAVLQRFAVCYIVVASLSVIFFRKIDKTQSLGFLQCIEDIMILKFQWIFMLIVILLHCLLTFRLKVPNCPIGYLGPGGLHENGEFRNCTGGAAGYIDELILGPHIYQHSYIVKIFDAKPLDPEGILGCLTSIFHVFLGVQAGSILLAYKCHKQRILRWTLWSCLCGLLGGMLCGFSKEDGIIPVNKNLWSLSFVFVTSCFAFLLLAACYIIIDVFKFWSGKPFLFAGMNAILMYVGHSMTYGHFPIHWHISMNQVNPNHFITLLENVWATSFWVFVSYYLYKAKFFWSL